MFVLISLLAALVRAGKTILSKKSMGVMCGGYHVCVEEEPELIDTAAGKASTALSVCCGLLPEFVANGPDAICGRYVYRPLPGSRCDVRIRVG